MISNTTLKMSFNGTNGIIAPSNLKSREREFSLFPFEYITMHKR